MRIRNLRTKLVLGNVLPILFLMPFLSLYLFYALEGFFSQGLLAQLVVQARLLADRAQNQPELTQDSQAARSFLTGVASLTEARVVLLSRESVVLASTRSEDDDRIGTLYADPAAAQALKGEPAQGIGPGFAAEVAYVVLPLRQNGLVVGALRLSYEVADLRAEFSQLQNLVLGGVALATLLGLALALGLASAIARPLRQLTDGARNIAAGDFHGRVSVNSRDEVGTLAHNFNQMAAQLEQAERNRERQLAAITHELTRPLAGLRAAVETLRDGADADLEMREVLLDGIEEELGRLERQLDTLRGLHQRAFNPVHLTRAPVALERIVRASLAGFEPLTVQANLTLIADVPSDLSPVWADEDRLIQVVTNLLDNAFKFTPRGGHITVTAGEGADVVWVRVADSGVGIAPDDLPDIFQQFFRGNRTHAPEKQGMGLGLTICREIVAAHGGRIEVESRIGQGACFTFTLPKA